MTSPEEHVRKLENMYATAPINRYYEPVLRISKGRAESTIAVKPDVFHASNAVHGPVSFTHPIPEGELRAAGTVVHHSKNLIVADSAVPDSGTARPPGQRYVRAEPDRARACDRL
jgi:acyl-coenzyme A thioesterase PaaI-like protein